MRHISNTLLLIVTWIAGVTAACAQQDPRPWTWINPDPVPYGLYAQFIGEDVFRAVPQQQVVGNAYQLPADRAYPWAQYPPGVTYNGGIPLRTNIVKTLSPCQPVGSCNDAVQINSAFNVDCANFNAANPNAGGGVVKLNPGVYNIISAQGTIDLTASNCTLRGSGPGTGQLINPPASVYTVSPPACGTWAGEVLGVWPVPSGQCTNPFNPQGTGTFLFRYDYQTDLNWEVIDIGGDPTPSSLQGILLTADAPRLSTQITVASTAGLSQNQVVYLDQETDNDPNVYWDIGEMPVGSGQRCYLQNGHCQCQPPNGVVCARSIPQVIKIKAINGNVLTLYDALSYGVTVANAASVTILNGVGGNHQAPVGIGVEELAVFGGTNGDYHGNVVVLFCDSCWIRHIDSAWSSGTSVGFYTTYKSELRDSHIHESSWPEYGGAGYLVGINAGAFGTLVENNVIWGGNKVDVMRASGGGNVLGYNYMDDAFGATYPDRPEAGINAGHYTTPHFELLEGNYSFNYKGDTYWGNSIYITVFRNWISGKRRAYGNLSVYVDPLGDHCTEGPQGTAIYADDYHFVMDIQGADPAGTGGNIIGTLNNNFVGNMLGYPGETLAAPSQCVIGQTGFTYDASSLQDTTQFTFWGFGSWQKEYADASCPGTNCWEYDPNTITGQLRQGNYDFNGLSARWYLNPISATGASTSPPIPLPNSLYLPSKPAFFGSSTWPWTDPNTGTIYTLPAQARHEAGTPNSCLNFNSTFGVCLD